MSGAPPGPLGGLRVVELASEEAAFAGKLLGELGADVVLVEPSGGHVTRGYGPWAGGPAAQGRPARESSLWWWHYNSSKRGVVLDLDTEAGRADLRQLIRVADIVLEAEPPGRLAGLKVAYADFADCDALVWTTVTPFGSGSRLRGVPATDLTIQAAAGPLWSCGYDDHTIAPARCEGNQAHQTASIFAVLGSLTAVLYRLRSGRGQHVDVSSFAASSVTTETATVYWLVAQQTVLRQTGRHAAVQPTSPTYARAKDGRWVHTGTLPRTAREFRGLLDWLKELGMLADVPESFFLEMAVEMGEISLAEIGRDPVVTEICSVARQSLHDIAARLDGQDFFISAQRHGLQAGVVNTVSDILADPHLRERGFFVDLDVPGVGTVRAPGPPFRMSATPWRIAGPAPGLGQDHERVFGEWTERREPGPIRPEASKPAP
jgi:crotonobetainyl-CoA:carnitine CoA-transferase CaiB-like acyl-CoA transferase